MTLPRPILIVGATQRCGTNFLGELLALHPATATPRTILEDYLPVGAGSILAGTRAIASRYPAEWVSRAEAERQLATRVGAALLGWLTEDAGITDGDSDRRLLTKTPGARELRSLVELAPGADVVALVRDGRDVAASGMRGLGWSFEEGLDRWQRGAREILRVASSALPLGARLRVVRYEDLVGDLGTTVLDLLDWLGLDRARYDLDAAHHMPVYGSSYVRGDREELHWDPVPRPSGFEPRGRGRELPEALQRRFAIRAGLELEGFGYAVPDAVLDRPTLAAVGAEGLRAAKRFAGWILGA